MQSIKKILKISLSTLIFFQIFTLLVTILNYFNIFDYKIMNIIKITIPLISFCFGGFKIGKKTTKNGWLEGLKLSSFMSITLIITCIILKKFKLSYLIYILILTISCVFGSMLGIMKNKTEK